MSVSGSRSLPGWSIPAFGFSRHGVLARACLDPSPPGVSLPSRRGRKGLEMIGRTPGSSCCMYIHTNDCPSNTPNRRPRTSRPRSVLGLSDDLRYACFVLLPRFLLLASSSSREDIPVRKRLHHGVSSSISSTPTSDSVSPTALPSHTATQPISPNRYDSSSALFSDPSHGQSQPFHYMSSRSRVAN